MVFKLWSLRGFRWLTLGIVMMIAALALTVPAIKVDLSNKPMLLATAYTQLAGNVQARFSFRETNEGSDVAVIIMADGQPSRSARVVLLSYVQSCTAPVNGRSQALQVQSSSAKPVFDTQDFEEAFTVSVPASVPMDAEVTCHLNVKPLRATYAERRVAFARDADVRPERLNPLLKQTRGDIYVFDQRNARDLKVDHAALMDGSLHLDNAYLREAGSDPYAVVMDWTDVSSERLHEFIYFIGAAVIGLSLSCFIEVARPWLSREGREKP
jgi:hypothetical protein